jgi:RNA polymerase sigma factor (sigma-70 family)
MPSRSTNSVIEHLRTAVLRHGAGPGDGELLGRFVERHDPAALAALVKRHGPMVWGVCRRLLGHHDAEDAFQATFLVLVRKAASVVPREMVGNWLYGVAHQAALQARRTAARRRAREVQVTVMPDPEAVRQDRWSDVQPLLDEELSRLPDNYRAVLVLCDLEGRTRKEVARQLGVPEGTVAGRLARARTMLAKRLTGRGVTLSGGALAAVLAQNAASAVVPDSVVTSTICAAGFVAAGRAAVTGPGSVKAAALSEGVLKAMMLSKLRSVVAVVLVLGFLVAGATVLSCRTAAQDRPPVVEERVKAPQKPEQEPEKEGFTAWGDEVGGLQAGLGFRPGQKRAYRHGEAVTLVLRVRNVGKEEVSFHYLYKYFIRTPPSVTDPAGKPFPLPGITTFGFDVPQKVDLAPGKEIELYAMKFKLRPASEMTDETRNYPGQLWGSGKFRIQYERLATPDVDPVLSKLATGKLELEVKSDAPPAAPKPEPEKEGFTAWGDEVGGLQAGLGFRPGQKRAYRHGETVTLVLRVRNVGKEEVKFVVYSSELLKETLPTVMDAEGKRVPQPTMFDPEGKRVPQLDLRLGFHTGGSRTMTLAPGKEVELAEVKRYLRPAVVQSHNVMPQDLFGTGKVSVQYEQVRAEGDRALRKLATGKLELDINPIAPSDPTKK